MGADQPRRRRDPERRSRILGATADLVARRGFHSVGMIDIGAEAGVVGPAIYRHFPSKDAILVALLDRVMNRLSERAAQIVASVHDDRAALTALVEAHVEVALTDRSVLAVYHREAHNLPEDDRRRLRRAQRHYLEEWVHLLAPLRRDLADGELRLAVHAPSAPSSRRCSSAAAWPTTGRPSCSRRWPTTASAYHRRQVHE